MILATMGLHASSAIAELSDADKIQKRGELDSYFSSALPRTEPLAPVKSAQKLRYTASGATRYGYDDNVDLDQASDGDSYYQERVGGTVEYDPNAQLFGRPTTIGVLADYDYLGYFDRDDMNRQSGIVAPFLRLKPGGRMVLDAGYEFRVRDYESQDDLSYLSHAAKLRLSHQLMTGLRHKAEFRYERAYYSDRKQLQPGGIYSPDEDRQDGRYTTAYGFRYHSGGLTLRLEGSWLWNDSNDQYFDYNDYNDFGLDGSVSIRTADRWILTGFGGWHQRSYDDRIRVLVSTETQEDDWYYAGGRIFFALNTWSGVDITATYSKNDSNDPAHDYDALNISSGYHLYF
jgi:hypothetical protein